MKRLGIKLRTIPIIKPYKRPDFETVKRVGDCFIINVLASKELFPKEYVGLTKTHLQHRRIVDWRNEVPLARTRQVTFVRLLDRRLLDETINSISL